MVFHNAPRVCLLLNIIWIILPVVLSDNNTKSLTKVRHVFPLDFVKFSCIKSKPVKVADDGCTWTFDTTEEKVANCSRTGSGERVHEGNGNLDAYEGYVEIPEKVTKGVCGNAAETQTLSIQNVSIASPLTRYSTTTEPIIVLQRSSNDYFVRFATHDVTNQKITINGEDVTTIKLFCIHNANVSWDLYSDSIKKIFDNLIDRDKRWIRKLADTDLQRTWQVYLNYLLQLEGESSNPSEIRLLDETKSVIYITPLSIRNITNATSRTYYCRASNRAEQNSSVEINVEHPRNFGPDEIEMIQQIIQIIDDLAQGKGKGKEPWYTLASLLSIVLILFVYYFKKKLEQQAQNPPPSSTPKPPDSEEVEMRTRLHQNQPNSEDSNMRSVEVE